MPLSFRLSICSRGSGGQLIILSGIIVTGYSPGVGTVRKLKESCLGSRRRLIVVIEGQVFVAR